MDDDWLSVQEAADRYGVTYRTICRMVRSGELPAEKPDGRPYRLRQSDVDALIERSRVRPGQLASAPPRIPPRQKADSSSPEPDHEGGQVMPQPPASHLSRASTRWPVGRPEGPHEVVTPAWSGPLHQRLGGGFRPVL